jgi:zinc transporter ZupT
LLLGWGANALLDDFPISRDEVMVAFDMAVYGKGRLAAPVAAQWRDYAEALVPAFLLNGFEPTGLVSAYLPVNALLRLGCSYVADPILLNPLLAFAGGIALYDIARRQFVDDARALCVTLLVYTLSSQMLINAMTMYAMTG